MTERFRSLVKLRVVDLSELPPILSMFDAGSRYLIPGVAFLHNFVAGLVAPIAREGREHIEYVPTQIVSEFIRHGFRTDDEQSLHGILYRSSKRPDGIACVLFIDVENCGGDARPWGEPEQVLELLEDRTQVLDAAQAKNVFPMT